jgi:glucokinase
MIAGVDIGGTKISVGMVDETGRVLARAECPTAPERGLADGLDRISTMIEETRLQADDGLSGIGVGCTGPVDPIAGTIGNVEFLPGWQGANLVEALVSRFNLPVAIENDADAGALGEAAWGAGRGASRFVYVTIGTGIGGGVVLDGQLYRGVEGAHPEIGHHVVDPSGPACFCGAHGCWESLASGPAMERWAGENPQPRQPQGGRLDAAAICAAAERGEAWAHPAVDRAGTYLGLGLANLVTIFTPEVIALGGGLMHSHRLFWDRMHEVIRTTCGLVPYQKTRLVPAMLGAEAGVVGAACVWVYRFRKH